MLRRRMMADLVTGFLRRVGEGLILRPYSAADQALVDEDLSEPVLPVGRQPDAGGKGWGDRRTFDCSWVVSSPPVSALTTPEGLCSWGRARR